MAIYFMHDNHTFTNISKVPGKDRLQMVLRLAEEEGGYGFIGSGSNVYQWGPEDDPKEVRLALIQFLYDHAEPMQLEFDW